MGFPAFFEQAPVLRLHDGLAELLGAPSDGVIEYRYADAVRLAGHSCPTVAGAWLCARAGLRALYGEMHPRAAKKVIDRLDGHCHAFITASPFVLIATTDGRGLDVSPKGDPAGSVVVEDDRHILVADRPGSGGAGPGQPVAEPAGALDGAG